MTEHGFLQSTLDTLFLSDPLFLSAQRVDASGSNTDLNLSVQIVDTDDNESTIETAQLANITRFVERAGVSTYWDSFEKAHFVTVRIPLSAFLIDGRDIDLDTLQSIRFVFDKRSEGTVAIDDIAFEN